MAELAYAVRVRGVASPTLRAAFGRFDVRSDQGTTVLRCADDEVHAVIGRVEEFGLELLEVRLLTPHPGSPPTG